MPVVLTLEPHREHWSRDCASEAEAVRSAVGAALIAIHHIGSTAIPGIHAKPILDMLAEVVSLDGLNRRTSALEGLGYDCMGEFGIPGRRYFRKDDVNGTRTHQIHAFATGSPHLTRHLAFRDYLRAHPEASRAYSDLKRGLLKTCDGDFEAYMDGKDAFIKAVERDALRWVGERDG